MQIDRQVYWIYTQVELLDILGTVHVRDVVLLLDLK